MKHLYFILLLCSSLTAQTFQSVVQLLEKSPVEKRQRVIEQYLNMKRFSPIIENDTLLHFVLYGLADSVSVNGNLQHWNTPVPLTKIPCGHYSFFYTSFIVPSDARLDYQLIINGAYRLDPQNPLTTPSGFGLHSEVRMPKFVPSPYLTVKNNIPQGSIDSLAPVMEIPTPLRRYLTTTRPIKVYRPAGYDTLANLPVLYVHDGFEMIDFAYLPIIIDNLIAEKNIPPILAVFIPPVDRGAEQIGEKTDRFVNYLCDQLVPMIDQVYRTDPSPAKRAVAGISSGATLSLYTLLSRMDVFYNAGGQSTTISSSLLRLTQKRAEENDIVPQLKVYLDCGRYDIKDTDNDFLEQNRNYSNLLSSLRIPHYYKEVNDGHEWGSWRQRLPEMLVYFFGTQ